MKRINTIGISLLFAAVLGACASSNTGTSADAGSTAGTTAKAAGASDNTAGAASNIAKAATVSDAELKAYASKAVVDMDKDNNVPPASNKYAKRLAKITKSLAAEDGLALNFKVYMVKDVNAFAMPDGSIRVFAGLMDMMTDDELRGVIGHEIGHVKLGHSLSKMRTAYTASAGANIAAAYGGAGAALLAEVGKKMINGQLSQSLEFEADDYAVTFLKKHKYSAKAFATGLQKIAKLEGTPKGGAASLFASHPDTAARVSHATDAAKKS